MAKKSAKKSAKPASASKAKAASSKASIATSKAKSSSAGKSAMKTIVAKSAKAAGKKTGGSAAKASTAVARKASSKVPLKTPIKTEAKALPKAPAAPPQVSAKPMKTELAKSSPAKGSISIKDTAAKVPPASKKTPPQKPGVLQAAQPVTRVAGASPDVALGAAKDAEVAAPVAAEKAVGKTASEKKAKRRDDLKIDRAGNIEQQWNTLFERSKGIKPQSYKMSDSYEAKTPLMHKVLGWGYVLSSQNNRLEVLFKDGIKILIANYKAS